VTRATPLVGHAPTPAVVVLTPSVLASKTDEKAEPSMSYVIKPVYIPPPPPLPPTPVVAVGSSTPTPAAVSAPVPLDEPSLHLWAHGVCPDAVVEPLGSCVFALPESLRWWETHLHVWTSADPGRSEKARISDLVRALAHRPSGKNGEWRVFWIRHCPGPSLFRYLQDPATVMTESDWCHLIQQVAVFLIRMDRARPGWRHGDLHPSNLMVCESLSVAGHFLVPTARQALYGTCTKPFGKPGFRVMAIDFDPVTHVGAVESHGTTEKTDMHLFVTELRTRFPLPKSLGPDLDAFANAPTAKQLSDVLIQSKVFHVERIT
jgi:hypothetical protein